MSDSTGQPLPVEEMRVWQHALAFLGACVIIVARRPDAILHPQLWAEDGAIWYADANNLGGIPALGQAWHGYFQTLPRIAAAMGLTLPLVYVPLCFNVIGICLHALPVNMLLSRRFAGVGSLRIRGALAATFVLLPNCSEVSNGVTNSQWFVAMLAFLVIAGASAPNWLGRLFDFVTMVLCGLTGPFCIFLLPVASFVAFQKKEPWRWVTAGVLAACACLQGAVLLFVAHPERSPAGLGASVVSFVHVLGGGVYLPALLGSQAPAFLSGPLLGAFRIVAFLVGNAVVLICFVRSSKEMRLLILFVGSIFVATLVSPLIPSELGISAWVALGEVRNSRYWFFPTLAFEWSVLWCIHQPELRLKKFGYVLLGLICVAIVRDFRAAPFEDLHFGEYARQFKSASDGTTTIFPLNPIGWSMRLVRHPNR